MTAISPAQLNARGSKKTTLKEGLRKKFGITLETMGFEDCRLT